MPRLKNDRIEARDLINFLDGQSDFGFELTCVERLSSIGMNCEHGGSYVDRVTQKARQFDIRARDGGENSFRARLAIECKNLAESFPVLIMCVPRMANESFHELVFSFEPKKNPWKPPAFEPNCKAIRVPEPLSYYKTGAPVGKSCARVGIALDQSITASDADVFEKWTQALASAHDLADEAATEGEEHESTFVSLILPILVVPDGTLWKVDYNQNGSRNSDPVRTDRCSFFVGREFSIGDRMRGSSLAVSHLEFVTLSGLEDLTKTIFTVDGAWFPEPDVLANLVVEQRS